MTVRIAGAGLAGLMAAITAARLGEKVEVFERKRAILPSAGGHTEALRDYGPEDALEELRSFGFDLRPFATVDRVVRRSEHFENVVTGKSYHLFLRGPEPQAVDQVLYQKALDAGVLFHLGTRAKDDVDIVATGPPQRRFNMIAAGHTFTSEGANLDPHTAIAVLDNNLAPGGYLAITPGVEHHSFYSGSWTDLDHGRVLARAEQAAQQPWIRGLLGSSRWAGEIRGRAFYARDPVAAATRGRVLLAGEAGGFQDAVAAYGFRYAVITGALAARSLVEQLDYAALLRATFGDEFERAYAYRERLDQATNADYDNLVRALGPRLTIEEYRQRRGHTRGL